MKKSRVLLCLLLAAATLLCACGKKGGGEQAADTPDYSVPDIQAGRQGHGDKRRPQ